MLHRIFENAELSSGVLDHLNMVGLVEFAHGSRETLKVVKFHVTRSVRSLVRPYFNREGELNNYP